MVKKSNFKYECKISYYVTENPLQQMKNKQQLKLWTLQSRDSYFLFFSKASYDTMPCPYSPNKVLVISTWDKNTLQSSVIELWHISYPFIKYVENNTSQNHLAEAIFSNSFLRERLTKKTCYSFQKHPTQ